MKDSVIDSYCANINEGSLSHQQTILAYNATRETDFDSGDYLCSDPRAYAAKFKSHDPDSPSFNEALTGEHAHEFAKAMIKEIKTLISINTWKPIPRDKVPTTVDGKKRPILPGTWAFKIKRLPDGSISKFKARYCV